jgi:hypothetical protein
MTQAQTMLELAAKIVDAAFNTPTCRKLKGDKRELVVSVLANEITKHLDTLAQPAAPEGCGDPLCKDPNCEYGKGPMRCQNCGALAATGHRASGEASAHSRPHRGDTA